MAIVSVLSSKRDGHDAVELGHRLGDRAPARRAGSPASARLTTCMPICSASAWASCSSVTSPMRDGDLAEQLAGPLLLLFEQRLQLVLGEEAEVDQDLTDAPNCHDRISCSCLLARGRCSLRRFLPSSSSSNMPRSALAISAARSSGVVGLDHDLLLLHDARLARG